MENRRVIFLGALVGLLMICSAVMSAPQASAGATGSVNLNSTGSVNLNSTGSANLNSTGSVNLNSTAITLALQNLFQAAANAPLQFQQQLLAAFHNGANVTAQTLQNLQTAFMQVTSQLSAQQQQQIQSALSALQSLTRPGLQQLTNNIQALLNASLTTLQQFVSTAQTFQTGLHNLIAHNPFGGLLANAANSLLQQLQSGSLTASLSGNITTPGVTPTFNQILQFLQTANNTLTTHTQDNLALIGNFFTLGATAFNDMFSNFFQFFG